jgi:glycolate dehydrogenase iron-sulfur subunit
MSDREHAPKIAALDDFLPCVHCGLCLSSCPTYLETGGEADSPRGRIYLMKAVEEGRTELTEGVVRHLDLCLGCRACETACPSGVAYGTLIEGARSYVAARAHRSGRERWKRAMLARWLPDASRLSPVADVFRLASRLGVPRLAQARWVPQRLRRLLALMPDVAASRRPRAILEPAGPPCATVALLSGCVSQAFFGRVNELTAKLLALAGYRVLVPRGQTCCGALLAHLGERAEAERRARRNVNVFLRDEADFIVTNAAGCGAMLREYGRWLERDPTYARGAREVAAKARDVSELLARGALPSPTRGVRARVAYHDACHLAHGQGVRREPRDLLRTIPGLELVELADGEICCGSAGTYNLTEPEMAWRLGERKAQAVLDSGAEIVAAGNPGCILQIRAALRLRGRELAVLHPIELLARAHGLA